MQGAGLLCLASHVASYSATRASLLASMLATMQERPRNKYIPFNTYAPCNVYSLQESHRKDQLLKQKDAELKALKGQPSVPSGHGAPPASGRGKPPLLTAAVRLASTSATTSRAASGRSASGSNRLR